VFQPLANGVAAGPFVVFADGFAGATKEPGRAAHRPTGLAVGPDGTLYIADDQGGRIWRVTYQDGDKMVRIASAQSSPSAQPASTSNNALPPEGIHPDAGKAPLPIPPGGSPDQVALGDRISMASRPEGPVQGATALTAGARR
jgi:hypothetical protein